MIDVDEVIANETDAPGRRSNWRDGAKGLSAIAVLVAFLVGGLYLASSTDETDAEDASSATDAAEALAEEAEPETSASQQLADDTTDPATQDSATEPTPRPRPTPAPDAGTRAELLATIDVGAQWLVEVRNGGIVAVDLTTGEARRAALPGGLGGENLLVDGGVIHLTFATPAVVTFRAWRPDAEELVLPGDFVDVFRDVDVGQVIVTTVPGVADQLVATAVETSEQRRIDLQTSLVSPGRRFTFAVPESAESSAFVTSMSGVTWGWTWEDGWDRLATGDVQHVGSDLIVVRECPGPSECDFSVFDFAGDRVVESIPWSAAGLSSLSADGETVAVVGSADSPYRYGTDEPTTVTVSDTATGERVQVELISDYPALRWSPNGRYLIVQGLDTGMVVDVESGDIAGHYQVPVNNPFASWVMTDDFGFPGRGE